MREESHLDDMRSAIRGDFERLAERRGGQELMSVAPAAEPDAEPGEPAPDPAEAKGLEPAHEPAAEPEPQPEQHETPPPDAAEPVTDGEAAEPEPAEAEEETAEPAPEPEETARRSWLDRMLGR